MKRAYLLLLGVSLLALNMPGAASAKLYEARLMGVDEQTADLVELSDVEEVMLCSPVAEQLSDDDDRPVPQKTDVPAPSGPMF